MSRSIAPALEGGALERLAVYGSLAPGRPNHHKLAALRGRWCAGSVRGRLIDAGWGAAMGFPGLVLDPAAGCIDVQVLQSGDLADFWATLDEFEGPGYRRIGAAVLTEQGEIVCQLYVLAGHPCRTP